MGKTQSSAKIPNVDEEAGEPEVQALSPGQRQKVARRKSGIQPAIALEN